MKNRKFLTSVLIVGVALLFLVAGVTAVFAQTDSNAPSDGPALQGPGFHGPRGFGDQAQFLADALGISVEELQAAQETAREAAIQQALDAGQITAEQAERLREGPGFGPRGFHLRGQGEGAIDHQALLADALGITVDELQAAQEVAKDAALQQAIDDGIITQEQVEQMEAFRNLKEYLDKEAIQAEALGITVEELQAAREEGKSPRELIEELGLDEAAVREAMQSAHTAAIEQAVADGVITQEQADQILSGEGPGFGPGFGGRGHRGGPGFGGPRGGEDTGLFQNGRFQNGNNGFNFGGDSA